MSIWPVDEFEELTSRRVTCDVSHHSFLCYYVSLTSSLFACLLVTIKTFLCYPVFSISSLFPCPVPLSQIFSQSTLFNHIKVLLLYVVKVFIGIINN